MLRIVLLRAILFTLLFSTFCCYVNAVPLVLSHQGRLLDASDAPLSGTFTIIYSIFDAPVDGTQLWMEDHVGVVVSDGLFSVELGSTVPLTADIFAGNGGGGGGGGSLRYLQVQISGQPAVMPRTPLVSSPYSMATERVSGDFQTRPGMIVIGDTALGKSATFGEKVNQGLHAAGSALASGASLIKEECDDGDADYMMRHSHGSFANFLHMHARVDSVGLSSSYSDATVETGMEHSSTTDGSSFSMSSKDNMPNRISMNVTVPKQSSASFRLAADLGDDGVEDNSVSMSSGLTSSRVAIKTKGTGADKNRIISNDCDDSSARQTIGVDENGDEVPDNRIDQVVTPTTSNVAIKTKGTGADPNRVLIIQTGATPDAVSSASTIDDDGDTIPESEISQHLTPTTSSLAIKTKGTSAQRIQSISGDCDDQSSVLSLDADDDGDGIAEGRGIISVKSSTGSGSMTASSRLSCDSNDDGAQESTVESSCDASSAKIIVDRDSGRSKGFMRAMETEASVTLENDSNVDGLVDRSVVSSVDSAQAEVLASEGSTQVSMKVRKGGVIKGAININHGGALRVDFDGDGNGYLSNALGIGVTPTHHIDVAGGAYCDGTNWVNASDKNSKENFEKVDGGEILEKISDLEITKWNYKGDDDAQHIGPTAQDFKKTFGVGADDKSISTIDPSGIALAAIKELYSQMKEKDKLYNLELQRRDEQLSKMQSELQKLREELKKK